MADGLAVGLGFAGMVVLAAMVLGTVHRREKFAFVLGVALVLVGQSLLSGVAAGVVALLGLVAVVASTVPLLLE